MDVEHASVAPNQPLRAAECQVLLVDVQTRLLPHIHDGDRVVLACVKLLRCAGLLGLPVTISEQYVRGLGPTLPLLQGIVPATRIEKNTFSCGRDDALHAALDARNRRTLLVVGIEAHVCVQQSVLDFQRAGYACVVLADAVGSRHALDYDTALRRMAAAGAVVTTTESAVFELLERCDTDLFKKVLAELK